MDTARMDILTGIMATIRVPITATARTAVTHAPMAMRITAMCGPTATRATAMRGPTGCTPVIITGGTARIIATATIGERGRSARVRLEACGLDPGDGADLVVVRGVAADADGTQQRRAVL